MNWILIATPAIGVTLVVASLLIMRRAMPLNREAPNRSDEMADAVKRTAEIFGSAIGAAIRDERQKGYEAGFESQSASQLEEFLSGTKNRLRS